ncbi:MAG: N-acetylmuramoyl-L-alanine amidase [Lachnospiraceae bacterium]|nr:N-acetylmuramoyl-L-alanine amidase [Lachnospiraceae bacterium]
MRKRFKYLTAVILSAAMIAGTVSPGFAEEVVDIAAAESSVNISEEGESSAIIEGESTDPEVQAESEAEAETPDGGLEADNGAPAEVSDNVAEGVDTPAQPEDTAELSEADAEPDERSWVPGHWVENFEYEYDGTLHKPGDYNIYDSFGAGTVYKIEKSGDDGTKGEKVKDITESAKSVSFNAIKSISQNYLYSFVPKNGEEEKKLEISVKITKRAVTIRSASYAKEYDGKPLSQNSVEDPKEPEIVKGSMAENEKFIYVFSGINKGDPENETSVPNTFIASSNGDALVDNYSTSYEYGNLVISPSRNGVNSLPTPMKVKAVIDNRGRVKLSWKKVKSYKSNGKKNGKTTYKVWRYSGSDTWTLLNDHITKASFIDSNPGENERLMYKVVASGLDSSGTQGDSETPAYVRATPKIVSASPYDGIKGVNVTFMGLGTDTDEYVLEHWNKKSKGTRDEIKVNKYNSTSGKYEGKQRTVSTNCYTDYGGSNVQVSVNKAVMCFRVMAEESSVYDYGKKVEMPESKWSKVQSVKMVSTAPVLRGERKSKSSFKLKWNKIKKANAYLLEWSKTPDISSFVGEAPLYCSEDVKSSVYNSRSKVIEDVEFGIPYYCRVTAYKKKKGETGYGTALGTSAVLVEYGRQEEVKNLKAEYFEDGNSRCDARLTWEDSVDNVKGYYIQRWSYAYNESTKKYDKETGYQVLQEYKTQSNSSNNLKKKYASTVGGKIENGELIKYRVQSVIYQGGQTGEYHDGYVFSEPSDYYYMNPSEVKFAKKKYTVMQGETLTAKVKFKPKKMPKTADGLTKEEFKKVFCFNDSLEFTLESDNYTASEIKKYVTVGTSSGKLKGVKTHKAKDINVKATSPNDPSEVYATAIVCVGGEEATKDKNDEKSSSDLTVCIDPGHGGKDDGATGNGITEKNMNLTIAKKVGKYLEKKGAKVYYTRDDDTYVSLTDRTDYADDKDCNLFVSIHCNSAESSDSNGTEVYYSVKSKYAKHKLANEISSAVSNALGTKNIGSKTRTGNKGDDYYSVIRTAAAKGIPGLIVEHAFLSNSSDAGKLKDDDKLDDMAKAEAEAIYKYWNK